jgi:hypothetical protein
VIIHFDRELIATAVAAALQNFAAIGSGHAFTETVHADTAANTGLICTFSSHSSVTSLNSDNNKNYAAQERTAGYYIVKLSNLKGFAPGLTGDS